MIFIISVLIISLLLLCLVDEHNEILKDSEEDK